MTPIKSLKRGQHVRFDIPTGNCHRVTQYKSNARILIGNNRAFTHDQRLKRHFENNL